MLMKYEPFQTLKNLDRDFSTLFRGFENLTNSFVPSMDVFETSDALQVEVECPGYSKDSLNVETDNGYLSITGTSNKKNDRTQGNYHILERNTGNFTRSFRLPNYVDAEQIKATYENGILSITIPKKESSKLKKVEIQSSENVKALGKGA